MKRILFTMVTLIVLVLSPIKARGDLFGGDVAVLSQILIQAIQQLIELKSILNTGENTLGLLKEINEGINDSLNLLKNLDPNRSPGLYGDWENITAAIYKLQGLYGAVENSRDSQIQKDADQSVAEAVSFNNSFYKWSGELDSVGQQIKDYSHSVSPGGAQKLSAQALGVIIQVLNQNLRAQATGLKLQAQSMAIENRKEKEATKDILSTSGALKTAMKTEKTAYPFPRF